MRLSCLLYAIVAFLEKHFIDLVCNTGNRISAVELRAITLASQYCCTCRIPYYGFLSLKSMRFRDLMDLFFLPYGENITYI